MQSVSFATAPLLQNLCANSPKVVLDKVVKVMTLPKSQPLNLYFFLFHKMRLKHTFCVSKLIVSAKEGVFEILLAASESRTISTNLYKQAVTFQLCV